MKGTIIASALLVAAMVIGTSSCSKQETEMQPGKQTTCPVMEGKKINPDLYVDANGKRIFVCCPGCLVQVKADPEKYIQQMETEGIMLDNAPTKEEATPETE